MKLVIKLTASEMHLYNLPGAKAAARTICARANAAFRAINLCGPDVSCQISAALSAAVEGFDKFGARDTEVRNTLTAAVEEKFPEYRDYCY